MSPIVFSGATVRFANGHLALDSVAAQFAPGAVTGIVGPNGAGKTTLLRVAAALQPLDSGACMIFDRAVHECPREVLARRIAYLPQGGDAAWPLPAYDIVALGRLPYGAALARLSRADIAAIERALMRADVLALADRKLDTMSAGERMRILFARALATKADVLLADEPAAHLDPAHQLDLMELLREEAGRGAAVAVTLHGLHLAARCDCLIVLHEGRVAAEGVPHGALSDEILARVFGVSAARAGIAGGPAVPVPWARLER